MVELRSIFEFFNLNLAIIPQRDFELDWQVKERLVEVTVNMNSERCFDLGIKRFKDFDDFYKEYILNNKENFKVRFFV
jgi:hypothetical protein